MATDYHYEYDEHNKLIKMTIVGTVRQCSYQYHDIEIERGDHDPCHFDMMDHAFSGLGLYIPQPNGTRIRLTLEVLDDATNDC